MDKIINRLQFDFPGHTFETKKGMFGQQLLVDGSPATATWDMGTELLNNSVFKEEIEGLSAEESMYRFLKLKVRLYLKSKGENYG